MLTRFDCPVCEAPEWETVRAHTYDRGDIDRLLAAGHGYHALRQRILFEVWFPDADTVTLSSVMCVRCGFMTYAPRPSGEDIDDKYRFLQVEERTIGGGGDDPESVATNRRRAQLVYDLVAPYAGSGTWRVVDVGGGDGKLLAPFTERGHSCALVDYNVAPLPGVTKIGDTLADVPQQPAFDVAICSHVLEHLADPAGTVREMAARLDPGGVLYAEVPLGVWGGIGIAKDPVTHINFFTKSSFEALFVLNGMDVLEARRRVGTYVSRLDVISVIARPRAQGEVPFAHDVGETRALLNPSLWAKLARAARLRKFPGRALANRVSGRR